MVSIIVINFNTFQLTCNCIRSIYDKTMDVRFEIILVDNASTECSSDKFKELFPAIVLVKSESNLGFAKGNNLGIQHSKGEVILLLNSDTELTQDSISICYYELMKQEHAGAITCKLLGLDNVLQHNCQAFPSAIKMIMEKTRIHKLFSKQFRSSYLQGFYWNYNKVGFPDWIWGTFFMFKKSILSHLPGNKLNDDYFMYIEDMKWCWDLRNANLKVLYIPNTSIIHHFRGSGGKTNELVEKNYQAFLDNNFNTIHKKIINFTRRINKLF